jgi:hypothetical protein
MRLLLLHVTAALAWLPATAAAEVGADCAWNGIVLKGKVKIVTSFPDVKIQAVTSFPDLKVKVVSSFPDDCGEWSFVESFPDFTVQYVESFPDVKIQFVDSFPGVP